MLPLNKKTVYDKKVRKKTAVIILVPRPPSPFPLGMLKGSLGTRLGSDGKPFYSFSRITFKDPHNQSVLNVLIQEVKALNPAFLTQHIRGNIT